MTFKRLGSYAILLSLVATASTAHAQSLNVSTGVDANVKTTVGTGTKATVGAGSSSQTSSGSSNAALNGSVKTGASNNTSVSGMGTSYSNGSSTSGASLNTFTIVRSDLKSEEATMQDPGSVTTSEEFSSYARAAMANDENMTKIESDTNHVSVWYKEPAKFLGIIPVMVNTEARVNADGSVQVNYPWWYNLFVKEKDAQSSTTLQSELNTTAGTIVRADASGTLSSSTQARIVNALRSGMKMHNEANVSAGTSTDATAY